MSEAQKWDKRGQYADMVVGYEEVWKEATTEGKFPYFVPIPPDWDSRPRHRDGALVRTNPRPRLCYEMCLSAKQYTNPNLGMVIAECWNEFGESSYLEPTAQCGFGFLDAMRDAFCEKNPHHMDTVPQSIDRTVLIFADVPSQSAEELADSSVKMLYNGDIKGEFGWVQFNGEPAKR